jgi:cobaltochelatase CobS
MATGNTTGNGDPAGLYPACRVLSAATLDRFSDFVNVPYMTPDEERALIERVAPSISDKLAQMLAKFANEMRVAFVAGETPISYSPRRSLAFARMIADLKGMGVTDEPTAISIAFVSKLYDATPDEHRQRLVEIARAAFGGVDVKASV